MKQSTQVAKELDDIMEDLTIGHNFDYARKALIDWRNKHLSVEVEENP